MVEPKYEYDVALSFAGEDRQFVQEVVKRVTDAGHNVFYDEDEQITLWGEELTEYFPKIYEEQARYAVMFISRHYAAKPWTTLERRSVLVRALNQTSPYLLPVRLDDTRLAGVRSTISYLDGNRFGPNGVADAIVQKLAPEPPTGGGKFDGYVPRNEHEAATLVGERPAGWEYLLFSYALVSGVEQISNQYFDHRMAFAPPGSFTPEDEVHDLMKRELATVQAITRNFASVLSDESQEWAFGAPGELGNVDHIRHVAKRYASVYEAFIDWASRLRGAVTVSDEAHEALAALAMYTNQPVERMRDFVYELRDRFDPLHAQIEAGESVEIILHLTLEISPESIARFEKAREQFESTLG